MRAAGTKNPPSGAGFNQEIANNSSYNNNLSQLYRKVNSLCQRWDMTREDFERAACVYSLMFRESAPRDIQLLYTGRPSLYSKHAKTLSLAFFLICIEASERLQALGEPDDVDASACWKIAIDLAGGTP
jgi:hypothetical protein